MYQDLSSGCPLPLEAASLCASSTVPYSDSQATCMAKVRRIAGLSLEVPLCLFTAASSLFPST